MCHKIIRACNCDDKVEFMVFCPKAEDLKFSCNDFNPKASVPTVKKPKYDCGQKRECLKPRDDVLDPLKAAIALYAGQAAEAQAKGDGKYVREAQKAIKAAEGQLKRERERFEKWDKARKDDKA
ncbi:hypothetical protein LTR85_006671 [Meristemomyces frigidus]|nr:hypothetical protein LTR85_006671 [Meristemomyces frigidus]